MRVVWTLLSNYFPKCQTIPSNITELQQNFFFFFFSSLGEGAVLLIATSLLSPAALCNLCVKAAFVKSNAAKENPAENRCRVPVNHPVRFSGNEPKSRLLCCQTWNCFPSYKCLPSTCPPSCSHQSDPQSLVWKKETNLTEWTAKSAKTASFNFSNVMWLTEGSAPESKKESNSLYSQWSQKHYSHFQTFRSWKEEACLMARSPTRTFAVFNCWLLMSHTDWIVFYWNQLNPL